MYELEETEKTDNGLDFLIKDKDGKWIAWTYGKKEAEKIVGLLNGYNDKTQPSLFRPA